MAVVGATPAVVSAFTFGLLTNAASAALFLYCRGHGSAIFRDGLRLVLIIFLASAALWAQIDFISVLLDVSSSSVPCQVTTIFATVFDQLARFSIEQYLLWAINRRDEAKVSVGQLVPQLFIFGRFIAGGVFAGFTRAQTDTFCVATSSVLPVAIVVIALDVVILLLLALRAFSTGLIANMKGPDALRSKSVVFVMLGFAIWTATSVTMLLGMETIDLAARTAAPAAGLTVLIIIVTACVDSLAEGRKPGSRPPEAPSPRRLNISRDISSSDSDYPPTRYEDLKEATIRSSTTFINPREAPRFKDETDIGLPTIARPITGISGVGGLPVQGALFPPPRAATVAPVTGVAGSGVARKVETSGSQKRRMFGRSASSAGNGAGRLVIGNPILQDNDAQNPLNKIPVVDLEEAARAEKERRARMQRESGLVAKRPAPQPPSMTPEEGLKRAVSLKRKEVQSMASQLDKFPASLQPEGAGMTTSAQLSPAADEVRRRSPRQAEIPLLLDQSVQPSSTSTTPALIPISIPEPQAVMAAAPAQPMPNMGIRPSRRLPSPKTPPPPEPTKTPLQRRPTIGLPSNPKARGLKIDQEANAAAHQTILFVNSISYHDPEVVEGIIKGANNRPKPAPTPATNEPGTPRSVVNRPRPIPRKVADPQPSPTPSHRRSKSGGSFSRKSILTSTPGSPTQLPPLPDLPKSAGAAVNRPQPNDTKSMTFDEKMTIFFPSPPSGKAAKRRSSVPELPRIPISYLDADSTSPTETNRMSNRTTIKTESVFDVDEITGFGAQGRHRAPSVADEVGTSWLPGIATEAGDGVQTRASQGSQDTEAGGRRASSPVIPSMPIRTSAWTESSDGRTHDDATTNWGSVHSPELAVGVPVARKVAQPTTIQKQGLPGFGAAKRVMPRPGDAGMMRKQSEGSKHEHASQWHHRVGDECPTFSARKEKTRLRKMPPPTPLMLNGSISKKPVYVQAEPSPVESPEHVLHQIQEQLNRFDDTVQNSPNNQTQRLALLENLEKEMGMQEDHWQEMKHDFGRDSLSSVQTSSPSAKSAQTESLVAPVQIAQESTVKSSMAERRASRRAQMRLSTASRRTSTQSNDNAQLSNWQKRLTEAQMEYMETAAKMLRDGQSNYLTMPMSTAQLGSPTPPESESDQSDDDDLSHEEPVQTLRVTMKPVVTKPTKIASLWTPPAPRLRSGPTKLLWHPAAKPTPEPEESRLLCLSVRPAPRKELAPLEIHSTHFWRKPHAGIPRPEGGLWRPRWASAAPPVDPSLLPSQGGGGSSSASSSDDVHSSAQKAPRPLTQRPPRRNKRVTLLPDILESPQPLPDKRGTLGIFQFPWGEKSDTASVQPTRLMAMPGTMASGGPAIEARSRQVEATEYSSSFFDDYDDDEEQVDSDDNSGTDSDDGFDETTLWEIASLLKTDNVPSKNSMFPPASSAVISDYMDELASDDESREHSIMIGLAEESREHFYNQSPPVAVESTTLWSVEDEQVHIYNSRPLQTKARKARNPVSLGLWQYPEAVNDTSSCDGLFTLDSGRLEYRSTPHDPAAKKQKRNPRPATPKPLEKLSSASLWTAESVPKKVQHHWTKQKARVTARRARPTETTEADWMAALNEAIIASYPNSKEARDIIFSTGSKIRHSRPVYLAPHFDSATRHPVFAASALVTNSEWFHPAATGYTYDPAIVNPVFFGSLAITCPLESVHPAMTSYAAKKLRRQRSRRHDTTSVSRSSSNSGSSSWRDRDRAAITRSDSNRMKRKEEIRAQLRALEQAQAAEEDVPALPQTMAGNDKFMPAADPTIQAQIEALEQERLFVERAAQEEYRRRTSTIVSPGSPSSAVAPAEMIPVALTRAESVEDLQRHLRTQVRESLILNSAVAAMTVTATARPGSSSSSSPSPSSSSQSQLQSATKMEYSMSPSSSVSHSHSHSQSSSISKTSRSMSLASSASSLSPVSLSGSDSPSRNHNHKSQQISPPTPLLWTPPTSPPTPTPLELATTYLWSTSSASLPPHARTNHPLFDWRQEGAEDAVALSRREKGRKQIQRQARRNEIFAQIAAIEAGIDIRAEFYAMGMWSLRRTLEERDSSRVQRERDWLADVCTREVDTKMHKRGGSRVELRY